MGFYLKKSVSVGPIRFNLSQSGIGVSTGIKGFKIGTGLRGNYVHMGRGGVYFRQTIPPAATRRAVPHVHEVQSSGIEFKPIESENVSRMVDSSSAALLTEINDKSKKPLIWPWILGLGICVLIAFASMDAPAWAYGLTAPVFAVGLIWAIYADKLRKTVVLFYVLEPHMEAAYQNFHTAFDTLRACSQTWHVEAKGDIRTTHDWKINAGAGHLVKRQGIAPYIGSPVYFKSNIAIPVLPSGRQQLYFLPDRILVWSANGVGAIGFDQIKVHSVERRFIEDGQVPRDSKVVDRTWKYVNKKGGPDRRFNNNRELPIVLYDEMLMTAKAGLREMFQVSRTGIGVRLNSAIQQMGAAIAKTLEPAMAERYVKCLCSHCSGSIEFPSHGIGQSVLCPHCGDRTILSAP